MRSFLYSPEGKPVQQQRPNPTPNGTVKVALKSRRTLPARCGISCLEPDGTTCRVRGLGNDAPEDETDDGAQLNEDIERGSAGVFQGIADGVASDCIFVLLTALAPRSLDVFLRIVPSAASVAHADRHLNPRDKRARQQTCRGVFAEGEAGD